MHKNNYYFIVFSLYFSEKKLFKKVNEYTIDNNISHDKNRKFHKKIIKIHCIREKI